jgi:hypothetical protein
MRKFSLMIFVLIVCQSAFSQDAEDVDMDKQLWKNAHLNWSTFKTHDYKWTTFGFGTAIGEDFEFEQRLSWKVGMDLNWNKYALYDTGAFYDVEQRSTMTMWSISVPLTVDYEIYKNFWKGINLYTGPVYEQILTVSSKQIASENISRAQFGWTFGTRFRFFAFCSLRLSYNHYFTGLFTNGDFSRSAIRLSVGF